MAKITFGPAIGLLIAKIIGFFRGNNSTSHGSMPSAEKLRKQVAGPIPPPLQTIKKGGDGKYEGEDSAVPLTNQPPCVKNSICRAPGFLYKPIGSALGTISLYMPILGIKVSEMALITKRGDLLWKQQSPGSPGDDGRPFWRTDVLRTAMDTGGWVRATFANGQVFWYPIVEGMIRNGSGPGNSPPYLYPFC